MRHPATALKFADMVTCSIGVQTSCPSSPTYTHVCSRVQDTCPSHFTDIHITKLEDVFSKKQKPDEIQLQILAMECNLLYKDVKDWFKARRLKWIEDLVKNEANKSDKNNNNNNNNITATKNSNNTTTTKLHLNTKKVGSETKNKKIVSIPND